MVSCYFIASIYWIFKVHKHLFKCEVWVIKINSSYEKLISKLGENVKIEKKAVVKECDFSKFISNESVRVLYSGINSKKHELEHIFAIYTLSEIQEIVPSR